MGSADLPYFDLLLAEIARGNAAIETSFGRHVHWGYWDAPERAGGAEDFARAAERLTTVLCDMARLADGQRILDAGCGFGGTVATIDARLSGAALTGLNIDLRQIERARASLVPTGRNQVAFVEGDACALPFTDRSFDRVLAVECIFHFPSRERFFAEASRVLEPGGRLALTDFVPSPAFAPLCRLAQSSLLRTRINAFGTVKVDCTLSGYRALAQRHGFDLVDEHDGTQRTLPTYDHLASLLGARLGAGLSERLFRRMLRVQRAIAARGLLAYRFMVFQKR